MKVLDVECGATGYGLMGFHLATPPITPEAAIPVMKHAYDSGAKFWSAAEFYGTTEYNSCHLIAAYFTQYPEHASQVIISVKVGMDPATRSLAADEAGIRKSVDKCIEALKGTKKIDIISCGRVDPDTPIEESIGTMAKLVEEGKVGAVGISECSAATLRKAAKVTKIVAVEVEFSLFTPDILSNGVAEAAHELGAVIAGYSPLGRGMLTGSITSSADLGENDRRKHWPRFQGDALEQNLKLVKEVEGVASKLGATPGQVALAWARAHDGKKGLPRILPIPGTTGIKRLDENMKELKLSAEDLDELNEIVKNNPAMGDRYPAQFQHLNWG